MDNGSTVTYDPKRVYGVNVYREVSRELATGDRLQFSAQNKELGVANRDLGTVTEIESDRLTVRMDGKEGRTISFNPSGFRQFDHGYAVTSHSSQGLTADRVIANFDTDSSRSLINNRLAYVAISRASEDARIYTNNAETLGERLATDVTKTAALEFGSKPEQQQPLPPVKTPTPVQVYEYNKPDSRLAAVAADYSTRPEKCVIVAPNRAERDELTQLARADLYAQGKLGREAYAIPVLVEKTAGSKMRVETYEPGDKIHYKSGSPSMEGIPHDSQATVISTKPKCNLLTVQLDATREEVTYSPSQLRNQTRESRLFREEVREVAEGERLRFTSYDKEVGVRSGDLGTVTRIGQDRSMTVQLDSGKDAELTPEKTRRIDYGYAIDGSQVVRADRIIATGDKLSQQTLQGMSPTADLTVYLGSAAVTSEAPTIKNEAITAVLTQQKPSAQRRDYGIGF